MASATNPQYNSIASVWSNLTSADRFAMLGHDRLELTSDEEATLARTVAELRKTQLDPGSAKTSRKKS